MTVAQDCIFCRIVGREVPSREAYAGPGVYGFHDMHPAAPLHVLLVPRHHIADASEVAPEHGPVMAEMMAAARQVAGEAGLSQRGYRLVFNVGTDAGAQVPHMHMHVLAGRELGWPPG